MHLLSPPVVPVGQRHTAVWKLSQGTHYGVVRSTCNVNFFDNFLKESVLSLNNRSAMPVWENMHSARQQSFSLVFIYFSLNSWSILLIHRPFYDKNNFQKENFQKYFASSNCLTDIQQALSKLGTVVLSDVTWQMSYIADEWTWVHSLPQNNSIWYFKFAVFATFSSFVTLVAILFI